MFIKYKLPRWISDTIQEVLEYIQLQIGFHVLISNLHTGTFIILAWSSLSVFFFLECLSPSKKNKFVAA